MKKNSLELASIARAGGSLVVDAADYNSLELGSVAAALTSEGRLTLINCGSKNSLELGSIAQAGGSGKVIFDMTR